jgi:hypothetical protein
MADKQNPNAIPEPTSGSRSKLLSSNLKNFLSKPAIAHPQKALTVQLYNAEYEGNRKQEQEVDEPRIRRDRDVAGK